MRPKADATIQKSNVSSLYIGLMSGTSMDGVDAALFDGSPSAPHALLGYVHLEMPETLRSSLLALNTSGPNELDQSYRSANELVFLYASATNQLLEQTQLTAADIRAIGAHGQTVRHAPTSSTPGMGYSIQINNPALLAELTNITVVADFRSRDIAAHGQGAPLVPSFHQDFFGSTNQSKAILNLGGIANMSYLPAIGNGEILGFDIGPANLLLDFWCEKHTGAPFDAAGAWSCSGLVLPTLLTAMLSDPYFSRPEPKSTGRDDFNSKWIERYLHGRRDRPQDVQATLLELTASSCAHALNQYNSIDEVVVCGGGALNLHMLSRLAALMPTISVKTSDCYGLAPLQVESCAFAWLAMKCLRGESANFPSVTGAIGSRILGAIYQR
jgi:anhydro-N-acetylmuramic acid kinase